MLRNVKVSAQITRETNKLSEKLALSAEPVLNGLAQLAFFDVRRFFHPDGRLKAIPELDAVSAGAIAGMEVEELFDWVDNGDGKPCGGKMDVFIEPILPKPELLIVGHGRIAEVLSTLGFLMGFSITVNDPAAERSAFPDASTLVTEDFDLTETPIGPRTFVVIATQHKQDHLWLQKALDGNAAYVALVASRHRAKLVLDYLASAGIPAEKIASVWAPAGLDLGAGSPEEIALSIMSQMVGLRRGGSLRPLTLMASDLGSPGDLADSVILRCETEGN